MNKNRLKEGERAIIIDLHGADDLKAYLLTHGITIGSIFIKNYSPSYANLINITISGKMLSLRSADFNTLEWTRI